MVQRKRRESTSPEKVEKFAKAATVCKSAIEAAIQCGFTSENASDADKARGASSWESTYSTMRRVMVDKLVAKGAIREAAESYGLKKLPPCAWGGQVSKSVEEVYGIDASELEALGLIPPSEPKGKAKGK